MSSNYGINRRSPFDLLGYFDSTKCFMHDLMHFVPEGVLNDCSALLLQYLILDPVIKLNLVDVNRKISTLKSSREFTVSPQIRLNEVLELKKLSFSSSEVMALSMCLQIALADFVSIENPQFCQLSPSVGDHLVITMLFVSRQRLDSSCHQYRNAQSQSRASLSQGRRFR
jgi:hypothetical protein